MSAWAAVPLCLVAAAVMAERCAVMSMLVARRTGFVDRPMGYKAHTSPTPYLGGAAVLTAMLVVVLSLDGIVGRFTALFACTALLWLIGTTDDRINVPPQWRVFAEVGAGAIIWASNLGFTAFASDALNLGCTILWVVTVVNAFNLMDNIDGACTVLVTVSAAGIGAAALAQSDVDLAVIAVALAGACLGFLRHNMTRPARIFLGDGGSMPLGFLIASLAMALMRGHGPGAAELCACGLFAGLPILDITLVAVSRRRRGVNVLTGGLDHLTHRLLPRLGTPRRVALALGSVQATLVTLAVVCDQLSDGALIATGGLAAALGVLALFVLESRAFLPSAFSMHAIGTPTRARVRLPADNRAERGALAVDQTPLMPAATATRNITSS